MSGREIEQTKMECEAGMDHMNANETVAEAIGSPERCLRNCGPAKRPRMTKGRVALQWRHMQAFGARFCEQTAVLEQANMAAERSALLRACFKTVVHSSAAG